MAAVSALISLQSPKANGLCDDHDVRNWQHLLAEVATGNCALFLGSGPSAPMYGTWRTLVDLMAEAANLEVPRNVPARKYPDFLQGCRRQIDQEDPSKYQNILETVFSPVGKDPYRPVHAALVRTRFKAFVTTNYDNCLENAGRLQPTALRPGSIQSYPDELSPTRLGDRFVTHLHGRAYDEAGTCSLPHIVLTREDFKIGRAHV